MRIEYDKLCGMVYGRLTVIGFKGTINKKPYVICKCSCGNTVVVNLYSLRSGNTKSCGCIRSELLSKRNYRHGLRYTPMYAIWKSMKNRCLNTNDEKYKYYGGSGIGICDEWISSFINFYNDMNSSYEEHIKLYGRKNTSLDRVNPNLGYCKENCVWATWKEQNNFSHKRQFRGNQLDCDKAN